MLSLGLRAGHVLARAAAWQRAVACGTRGHCFGGPRSAQAPLTSIARVDRFRAVTVHLEPKHFPPELDEVTFQKQLQDAIKCWKAEGKVAVWLCVPILQSRFITAAAAQGFTFHHAEKDNSTLALWLAKGESRLPAYATHQVGVAGAVLDEATGKVLVVQDKNKGILDGADKHSVHLFLGLSCLLDSLFVFISPGDRPTLQRLDKEYLEISRRTL
uniref:nucleoside diphosphate-linked moiety X motif 6 isoform X3 n=1 Tax=Pristiophorus japonicus TaxID=55135 RepID=UPI00398F62BD